MEYKNKPGALAQERIGKLLVQYSLPAIASTAAISLYNIIDRIFIGHGVGPMAISGLALTFPLMNITAAFGALVGAGAATLVSIRLGQHNRKEATLILGNTVRLNLIIGIAVSVITLLLLKPILFALGASAETYPYARDFMQVILAGNVITHLYMGLNNIMRASGYPRKAMLTTLITVGINLVLAPLFIFVFGWGIRGAALATILAQLTGTTWLFFHFFDVVSFIHFLPGYFRLKWKIITDIFSIGMANFFMLFFASLVFLVTNRSLAIYGGDFAIGAFGIIQGIGNLVAMVVLGFNQGMQPIAGYNYGACQYSRVIRVFKLTLVAGTITSTIGFAMAELIPRPIALAFTSDTQLIDLTVTGMRINLLLFPIVGFQMVTTTFFQSIGKAKISIFLSLTRQAIFLIPALLILPRFYGLNGVWASGPVADLLSSVLTLTVLYTLFRKKGIFNT
jgi:putative MATE family efflux protein